MTTGRERVSDNLARAWLTAAAARGAAVPAYDLAGVRPSVVHIGPWPARGTCTRCWSAATAATGRG